MAEFRKQVAKVEKFTNTAAEKSTKLRDNLLKRLGGGEKKIAELKQTSPELEKVKQEAEAAKQAEEVLKNTSTKSKNLKNLKNNKKRLKNAANLTTQTKNNLIKTEEQVTQDALHKVRKKGLKRLYTLGTLGALGIGAYNTLSGSPTTTDAVKETPQKYKYDPNKGWQEYDQATGQYKDQQKEFGVDRFGNTNYYDGNNWLTPDQYLQGSNGYIYNKQTGQIIGTADDTLAAITNGYDSVFDYRAAKAGYKSPEAVKELQQKLGINADGKWGQQTQDAFDRFVSNYGQQYDPNSLFSIYQRKMQFGY